MTKVSHQRLAPGERKECGGRSIQDQSVNVGATEAQLGVGPPVFAGQGDSTDQPVIARECHRDAGTKVLA